MVNSFTTNTTQYFGKPTVVKPCLIFLMDLSRPLYCIDGFDLLPKEAWVIVELCYLISFHYDSGGLYHITTVSLYMVTVMYML